MKGPTSKLRKFSQLTSADQWLLVRAALWLGVARTLLATMSFDRLSEHLVEESGKTGTQPDREFVDRVGYAVRAASGAVPWRADCFPQTKRRMVPTVITWFTSMAFIRARKVILPV